jgi:hypothetical protein
MKNAALTEAMKTALKIAYSTTTNAVYSGYNPGSRGVGNPQVSASAIRGLERRGYVAVHFNTDGSLTGTLTRAGAQVAETLFSA